MAPDGSHSVCLGKRRAAWGLPRSDPRRNAAPAGDSGAGGREELAQTQPSSGKIPGRAAPSLHTAPDIATRRRKYAIMQWEQPQAGLRGRVGPPGPLFPAAPPLKRP